MVSNVLTYLKTTANKFPDKTALSDRNTRVTYAQFWARTSAVGTALYKILNGARRQPVFVSIDRTLDSLVAFMGVVASGNFYVPIDPALPDARLEDLHRTMSPRLLITTASNTRTLPFKDTEVLPLHELTAYVADEMLIEQIAAEVLDVDPLYCIFTSGSTGIPKGVLVSHRSVIDMAEQFTDAFSLDDTAVFGNQAPFDFDVSVKDIYLAMKNGATVQILEKQLFSMPKMLIARMNERQVNTIIWSVSAMKILSILRAFDSVLPNHLRLVMFSGEALPCKILRDWTTHLSETRFVNLYGPTEITCNCTYYKIERAFSDEESLPIGRPFPNTQIILLDGDTAITEIGHTGEICVAGTCLALGYYRNEEQTARAFCQNPLQNDWPQRIYRTGDLGQWDSEGNLLFMGRADSQVKYMGFRIELSEIEIAANAVPFVSSACCLFDQKKEQLCLFYQAEEQNDKGLMMALQRTLPRGMIPTKYYFFEKLPENRTGKIDRAYLRKTYLS